MSEENIIFPFRNNGADCGFLTCSEPMFVFKPDKWSAATIPVENLKKNLRLMVKNKSARLLKAGQIEAVVVPRALMWKLFL